MFWGLFRRHGRRAQAPDPVSAPPVPSRAVRAEARGALKRFGSQAEALMQACLERGDHPPVHQAEDFTDAVADYLRDVLGQDWAERFAAAPLSAPSEPPAAEPERQRLWLRLASQRARLLELMQELR